jgi:hypothetical protein
VKNRLIFLSNWLAIIHCAGAFLRLARTSLPLMLQKHGRELNAGDEKVKN